MTTAVPVVKPTLRPYQTEARDSFLAGEGNMLVQLPTGTGKTQTSVAICDSYPGERVLFLAHTGTLVYQTCHAFLRNGIWPNVEKADEYTGGPYLPDSHEWKEIYPDGRPPNDAFVFNRAWVSTIQTFCDRVDKYREDPFDLIVLDECHRALGRTWLETVEKLVRYNPMARVCGLSATPFRGDKQNLGKLFPQFAYRMTIVDGIDGGWLVPIVCERATLSGVDESMWKLGGAKGGRDITDDSLTKSMNNKVCIESIAHEVLEHAGDRKGILFLPGVAVTESVSEALNALRPGCSTFVHGGVKPKKENRRRIRQIKSGDVQFVCGCDQLIEGFDVPDIALVVMARFTAQRGRYEQMLGRGLRVLAKSIAGIDTAGGRRAAIAASAKPDCKVLDFANNSRFRLVSVEDVLLDPEAAGGGKRSQALADYVKKHRDQNDKRLLREQLEEFEALSELREARREAGGIPEKANYNYEHVNLFGYGGVTQRQDTGRKTDSARPTTQLIEQAYDVMVPKERAEKMTQNQLLAEIAKRRETKVGRKLFGFLVYQCKIDRFKIDSLRLNWYEADYLKRLTMARPNKTPPANWEDLVMTYRRDRKVGRVK